MNKLDQLKTMTTVVGDTGDIVSIRRFQPVDATTNPTLLLKAAQQPESEPLLQEAIEWAAASGFSGNEFLEKYTEKCTINVGREISEIVPGRVSAEVDTRLSFNTKAMVHKAHHMIDLYAESGVPSKHILIKRASTWEGIQAARVLEENNIQCNLTLLFSFAQAAACADAGVTLISPFIGRIYDWYQNQTPDQPIPPREDPGVKSVQENYQFYKQHGYKTIVMGASFRSIGQIEELAGCDNLTVSPDLLEALENDDGELERKLNPEILSAIEAAPQCGEKKFRWQMNEDAMATERLAEGIRYFAVNQRQLEDLIKKMAS